MNDFNDPTIWAVEFEQAIRDLIEEYSSSKEFKQELVDDLKKLKMQKVISFCTFKHYHKSKEYHILRSGLDLIFHDIILEKLNRVPKNVRKEMDLE